MRGIFFREEAKVARIRKSIFVNAEKRRLDERRKRYIFFQASFFPNKTNCVFFKIGKKLKKKKRKLLKKEF